MLFPEFHLGAAYALTAAAVFAIAAAMALRFARTHYPFTNFGPANWVTLLRAALVALVAA